MAKKLQLSEQFKNLIFGDHSANTVLWSGDSTTTAINTSQTIEFEYGLRPQFYKMCFAHFNIDGTHLAIPFVAGEYKKSMAFSGYWGINTSAYAYITVSYGGYSSLSWQIKQILGKNVNQVHLIEIIGIK